MTDWLYRTVFAVDWHTAFVPQVALLDIALRGTVIYLVLFAMLRITRRQGGAVGTSDVLIIVLIADAVQNAMASEYKSLTEGIGLALTIFFWSWCLDWLAFHVPRLRPFIEGSPHPVIRDGKLDRRAMRRELLTEEDLRSQLRLQGITDVAEVRLTSIENDGALSVQRRDGAPRG